MYIFERMCKKLVTVFASSRGVEGRFVSILYSFILLKFYRCTWYSSSQKTINKKLNENLHDEKIFYSLSKFQIEYFHMPCISFYGFINFYHLLRIPILQFISTHLKSTYMFQLQIAYSNFYLRTWIQILTSPPSLNISPSSFICWSLWNQAMCQQKNC